MIITKTPFRMSFFGGGTDMEEYFRENGGAVLSTTFDKYCYVNVRHLPRFFDYTTELSYSRMERVSRVEDIQHPAVREAMKMLDMHEIRLTYEADLPARSGLGTSSSFAVGMLNAFYALKGNTPTKNGWRMRPSIWSVCSAPRRAAGRIRSPLPSAGLTALNSAQTDTRCCRSSSPRSGKSGSTTICSCFSPASPGFLPNCRR